MLKGLCCIQYVLHVHTCTYVYGVSTLYCSSPHCSKPEPSVGVGDGKSGDDSGQGTCMCIQLQVPYLQDSQGDQPLADGTPPV